MQSVSSRIWTRVAVSISYDDNHYITGTSTKHDTIYTFSKGITPKVNVVMRVEFEQTYLEAAVQHFSLYARWTSLLPE